MPDTTASATSSHSGSIRVAPLDPASLDPAALDGARALFAASGAPELVAERFERALGETPESRAVAAFDGDGAAAGIVLFGLVAGALGTGAVFWLAVRADRRRHGVGRALLALAKAELAAEGARIVIAEVPDDAAGMAKMLAAGGFEREGVVPDFYRDGVALDIWRYSVS
jgi:ribosomal protein S18 acetylase RimI-like enzyme